jgi:hypothetical protein
LDVALVDSGSIYLTSAVFAEEPGSSDRAAGRLSRNHTILLTSLQLG